MKIYTGRITTLEIDGQGRQAVRLACPAGAAPGPGQVVMGYSPTELDWEVQAVLATPLFLGAVTEHGFLGLPLEARLPAGWLPGGTLQLRGPLGKGFSLPNNVRRLALGVFGETAGRLLPLAQHGLAQGADVTIFTDQTPAGLPARIELQPLNALPEALAWADFLAIDLPREALPRLRQTLRVELTHPLPCLVQALVSTAMPCAGLAACGACALPARGGWKLVCEDGPVFNLQDLEW